MGVLTVVAFVISLLALVVGCVGIWAVLQIARRFDNWKEAQRRFFNELSASLQNRDRTSGNERPGPTG